jgi:archaemetzincin
MSRSVIAILLLPLLLSSRLPVRTVHILPLGQVKQEHLQTVAKAVESYYGFRCVFRKPVPFKKDILSPSRTRYDADSILAKYRSDKNTLVVTESDITSRKGNIREWGVLGLGYINRNICVVSTFRMGSVKGGKFNERLSKVAVHELGHNLGLNHCERGIPCLMSAANGKASSLDRSPMSLCKHCRKAIGM